MTQTHGILIAIAAVAGIALAARWWRRAFALFCIRPHRMTVARLGLSVYDDENVRRVNGVLRSFAEGFNEMIAAPAPTKWRAHVESLPAFEQPFAHEGAGMGYTLRKLGRYDATAFEDELVRRRPDFRYLYYVGLGFWWGMRRLSPRRVMRLASGLDPMYRHLCFDGYGFKHAFFDYPKDPDRLRRLHDLEGYARNAAFQGVGRAFWFRFMDEAKALSEHIGRLGDYAADAAAGMGLAVVFTNPDRIDVAVEHARRLPAHWHPHVHLGMCFGLKARSINDPDEFDAHLSRQPASVRDAVLASIRECDRVELQVRADADGEKYRRWRSTVTEWMERNIAYPLQGVKRRTHESAEMELPSGQGE